MPGARLKRIRISRYRSIDNNGIDLQLPSNNPLVLIGENNAGKSNILRAIDLVLGDFWPGNHKPEDHEHFGRSSQDTPINIRLDMSGLTYGNWETPVTGLHWRYEEANEDPCEFLVELDNGNFYRVNGPTRDRISSVYISNERDLKYQLSYTSKYTALSRLMRNFHKRLTTDEERVQKLKTFTQSLIDEFDGVEEFSNFKWNLEEFTQTLGGNLPYGLSFDFSAYDPSNFFQTLRLLPHLNGAPRNFDELGTGQGQILSIAFLWAYARAFRSTSLVLLLEEPESHLHPLAQQWLADKIRESAESGVQVIMTTHSPYFIDLTETSALAVVSKEPADGGSQVIQLSSNDLVKSCVSLGAPASVVRPNNIGVFYELSSAPSSKAALFAPSVLLVEGPTEEFALPILLKHVGLDLTANNFALVPVDGVDSIAKWVRFYSSYDKSIYVIIDTDSDKSKNDRSSIERTQREILRSLNLPEDLISANDALSPISAWDNFAVLDSNFEKALERLFGETYVQARDKAAELFGQSKPIRGRYIAQQLTRNSDLFPNEWKEIKSLASRILGSSKARKAL